MAPRTQGSLYMDAAIEPKMSTSLDARFHVRDKAERLHPDSFSTLYSYKGMITASGEEEKLFFLLDRDNPQLEESWMEIGPYDDTEVRNLITQVNNRITNQTIQGGTGISVTRTGDNYTIVNTSPGGGGGGGDVNDDYMIISKTPNIIITSQGDSTANTFTYNASISGASADNNMLEAFTSGVDKIRIRGTSLATGALTTWATSGAGIYYDSSSKTISYNNGTSAKSVVKIVDGSTVVPGDVEII